MDSLSTLGSTVTVEWENEREMTNGQFVISSPTATPQQIVDQVMSLIGRHVTVSFSGAQGKMQPTGF